MVKIWSFALAVVCAGATPALAQQGGTTNPTTSSFGGTPGVSNGTTGTTYSVPGSMPQSATPGGTIPMAAGTQDTSKAPSALPNFNNTVSTNSLSSGGR
ncbi:hypothetical protein SAMN02745126_00424 [Enhydrobacter aerosaccus]|uniref:Uncharacterized protein n=1 Tax=Enhydrobacter aerosaccus TaxID=225324 RepID=A0A1T4JSR0_9HYPH|nr:hypothetical protein [Enhydrobacter aerosaccus]SJZ33198.1 hypothetical protein SAMN02745126_00424 [Enhydrobacter aerosaccus]